MRRPVVIPRFLLIALLAFAPAAVAAPAHRAMHADSSSFAAKTKGFARRAGLLATWLDAKSGRLLLELPRPAGPRNVCGTYLYLEGIETGLGSNAVGLDRGQEGQTRVVELRRVGERVLIEEPNQRYRAASSDSVEARTVRESFATSVLWAGDVAGEAPDGRLLVDLTSFLVRDAHRVAATLKSSGQGAFALDEKRSVLDPAGCRSFPDNLEFAALLTFAGEEAGAEVRQTTPTPQAVTLVEHQSLVRLPDDGYRTRAWDPRSGSFGILYADYARPIGADIDVRQLVRFRLEKLDPAAARSRVKKPIVYYVDAGAPEPIRSALVEGASWWAKAFEAAGFLDAFQVKLLPPDADPLDVRYNVIEWVHRSTRGWSYGGGVIDPRTGEMIKGHVTLGSLRIRQDRMIFEGLAGAEKTGSGAVDDPVQISLARIRQLAAHEVGHTLGFNHNFAASTYAGRASVMDYPAPLIGIRRDSTLDFSNAYATGIGVWDVQQVRYAYTEFAPAADVHAGLEAILRENRERGYVYISDADTRPLGAAHPLGAMWDNGADPIAELAHEMAVRRIALARFGEHNVAPGTPLSTLAETLVPLYFHHRYAMEAAVKSVGGLEYSYAVSGDGSPPARPVPPARQRAALAAVLATLAPAELDLPEPLLGLLPPPSVEYPPHRELMGSKTAPAFDALGAAATWADFAITNLLAPERLARCVDFHRRDPAALGVDEVLDAMTRALFAAPESKSPRLAEIRRSEQAVFVSRMIAAAANPANTPAVRAAIEASLRSGATGDADAHMRAMLNGDIARYVSRSSTSPAVTPPAPPELPPGAPIGMPYASDECEWAPPR
jgi:hypothetical protein